MDVSNKLVAVFDSKGANAFNDSLAALLQYVPQEKKTTIERQFRASLEKANAIGSAATPAQAQELLIIEAGRIQELEELRNDNEFKYLETYMALLPVWEDCSRKIRPGKKQEYIQQKYGATDFKQILCRKWSPAQYSNRHREIMACRVYIIRLVRPDYGIPPMGLEVAHLLQNFLYKNVKEDANSREQVLLQCKEYINQRGSAKGKLTRTGLNRLKQWAIQQNLTTETATDSNEAEVAAQEAAASMAAAAVAAVVAAAKTEDDAAPAEAAAQQEAAANMAAAAVAAVVAAAKAEAHQTATHDPAASRSSTKRVYVESYTRDTVNKRVHVSAHTRSSKRNAEDVDSGDEGSSNGQVPLTKRQAVHTQSPAESRMLQRDETIEQLRGVITELQYRLQAKDRYIEQLEARLVELGD